MPTVKDLQIEAIQSLVDIGEYELAESLAILWFPAEYVLACLMVG